MDIDILSDGTVFLLMRGKDVVDLVQISDNNFIGSHVEYKSLKTGSVVAVPKWMIQMYLDNNLWVYSSIGTKIHAML